MAVLSPSSVDLIAAFRAYAREHVALRADAWDENQEIPREVYTDLGTRGWLAGPLDVRWGGAGWSAAVFGEFCAAIGEASMSLLSTLTVHHMAMAMIAQWGEESLQERVLPELAAGRLLGGFGLTEPEIGCAATEIGTRLQATGDGYTVSGQKKWISGGQHADGFVLLTQLDGESTAVWVERARGGVTSTLIPGMLGFRAAMNTDQRFEDCPVPADAILGTAGGGFAFVFSAGLDLGRFIIAWGALGLQRACLVASTRRARSRHQFGKPIAEHQLIQRHLAEMHTDHRASEGLCRRAAQLRDEGVPSSLMETATAKYFASKAASRIADRAVQIHGAAGCGPDLPIQRYLRDARITEMIEGSNEMQEIMLGQYSISEYAGRSSLLPTGL